MDEEFKMFQDMLTIKSTEAALIENEVALKDALRSGQFQTVCDLKTQRDELQKCLIVLLKTELAA